VDSSSYSLVRPPRTRQNRDGVVEPCRTRLGAEGQPWSRPDIRPIQSRNAAIDPDIVFRDRILGQREGCAIGMRRLRFRNRYRIRSGSGSGFGSTSCQKCNNTDDERPHHDAPHWFISAHRCPLTNHGVRDCSAPLKSTKMARFCGSTTLARSLHKSRNIFFTVSCPTYYLDRHQKPGVIEVAPFVWADFLDS
jgi:hypothetical protein